MTHDRDRLIELAELHERISRSTLTNIFNSPRPVIDNPLIDTAIRYFERAASLRALASLDSKDGI